MKKLLLFVLVMLSCVLTAAALVTLTLNSPGSGYVTEDNYALLNFTVHDNDSSGLIEVSIYGSSSSVISNDSLIYRLSGVTNGTDIIYNWTSPKITPDANTVLLMYFDNQSSEALCESSVSSNTILLYHMNNDTNYFENDTQIYDFSGNNNATVYGAVLSRGRFNSSFEFDGNNDYIDFGNSSIFNWNLSDNWTYEFWVKIPATEIDGPIISQRSSTNSNPLLDIMVGYDGYSDVGDGELTLLVRGDNGQGITQIDSNTRINDDQWHHVAAVRNTKQDAYYLYIDGALKASAADNLNDGITTNLRNIANSQRWVQDSFTTNDRTWLDCSIDEFAVHDVALTLSEIRNHAHNRLIDQAANTNGSTTGTFNNSGKLGPGIEFDGADDYLAIPSSDSLNLSDDFSISFWAFPYSLSSDQTFLVKGSGTETNYYIDFVYATNELEFGWYNSDWRGLSVDASDISEDRWNLITVTRNSSDNKTEVYINGHRKGSLVINQAPLTNSQEFIMGYFPGYDQHYQGLLDELVIYNKTLDETEVEDIYQLNEHLWYWKYSAEDSEGINISSESWFDVGSVWSIEESDLGSVGTSLNTNTTLGTIVINNTHSSRNISITLTSDYTGDTFYSHSFPLNITAGSSASIEVNATSPLTEGSTSINFNVTATDADTGADSVPFSSTAEVVLVATSSQPYLVANFETYPTIVSQGNSGLNIIASVVNRGQGNAQDVALTFVLPDGWTNSSGATTQDLGILLVNEHKNASVQVNVGSSASSGTITIYATVAGENSTGDLVTSNYTLADSVNVTVNSVSEGNGPSSSSVSTSGSSSGGGGGRSVITKPNYDVQQLKSNEFLDTSEDIEIVKGLQDSFRLKVENIFKHTILKNIKIKVSGYLSDYLKVTPIILDDIAYQEYKEFTITIDSPKYLEKDEYDLTIVITGDLDGAGFESKFTETRQVKLIVHDVSEQDALLSLQQAEQAIQDISGKIPYTQKLQEILQKAKDAFNNRDFGEAKALSDSIIKLANSGLDADEMISALEELLKPRPSPGMITGSFIGILEAPESAKNLLALAKAAFERGDFATALSRVKEAQLAYEIESRGSTLDIFSYLIAHWIWVLILAVAVSMTGFYGYTSHEKAKISDKILALGQEEQKIHILLRKSQNKYYSKKSISVDEFHREMAQYNQRLADIKRSRIHLRNKRLRLLKPSLVLTDLDKESKEYLNSVKKLQKDYYDKKAITEDEYNRQLETYSEMLAEIEDERLTLKTQLNHKNRNKREKWIEIKIKDKNKKAAVINRSSNVTMLSIKPKSTPQNIEPELNSKQNALSEKRTKQINEQEQYSEHITIQKSKQTHKQYQKQTLNKIPGQISKQIPKQDSRKPRKQGLLSKEELTKFFPITAAELEKNKKNEK